MNNGTANGALTIEGTVQATNERGIKVNGEWLNRSQFRPVALPDVGAAVRVETDAKGFIKSLEVLEVASQPAETADRDVRIAVLAMAAGFGQSRPDMKSADVLAVAKLWLAWVNWVEQSPQSGEDR